MARVNQMSVTAMPIASDWALCFSEGFQFLLELCWTFTANDQTSFEQAALLFAVDTSAAGMGDLEVAITHHGLKVHTQREALGDGRFRYTFLPGETGHYEVEATFNNDTIPGEEFLPVVFFIVFIISCTLLLICHTCLSCFQSLVFSVSTLILLSVQWIFPFESSSKFHRAGRLELVWSQCVLQNGITTGCILRTSL